MPRRKRSPALQRRQLGLGARVYAYLRDSGGNSQELSVTQQRAELEAYAAARGWVIAGWYVDEARQSSDLERREAFFEMVGECKRTPPPVSAVLVWSLARLFRDEIDAQYFKSDLRRRGVDFLSATDAIPDGPFGYIYEAFLDCANRIQIDKMAVDVRRGLRSNVAAGYAPGGRPPVGYRAEKTQISTKRDGTPRVVSKWVEDPDCGPRVRRAFEMYAAGHNLREIHAATGLYKSPNCYTMMFRNRTYLGILKLGQEEFPDRIPALCDPATWQKVEARVKANTKFRPHTETEFLLSGLLFCGECGRPMSGGVDMRNARRPPGPGHGRPWRYYRCQPKRMTEDLGPCSNKARVPADRLEAWVRTKVLNDILTPANVRAWTAEMQARLSGDNLEQDLAATDRDIARARRSRDNWADLVDEGDPEAKRRYRQHQAELSRLELTRDALTKRQAAAQARLTDEQLETILEAMRRDVAPTADMPVAKRALRAFVEKVEVIGDMGRILFRPDAFALIGTGVLAVPPRGHFANSCIEENWQLAA